MGKDMGRINLLTRSQFIGLGMERNPVNDVLLHICNFTFFQTQFCWPELHCDV